MNFTSILLKILEDRRSLIQTTLPAGDLLLFVNTDPSEPNMPLAISENASYHYLVDESLTLPQEDFLLLLRSPTEWEDSAGSYLFGHEDLTTKLRFFTEYFDFRFKAHYNI